MFGYSDFKDIMWGNHSQLIIWLMAYQITFNILDRGNALCCSIFVLNQCEIDTIVVYMSKDLSL